MNMNTVPKKSQHTVPSSLLAFFAAIPLLVFLSACTTSTTKGGAAERLGADHVPAGQIETGGREGDAPILPPDPGLTPPADLVEQPLNGSSPDAPEVWLVPSLQSKEELAIHIGAELAQLNWVNPGLPEPVPPGTLIVVPPGNLAQRTPAMPVADRLAVSPGIISEQSERGQ